VSAIDAIFLNSVMPPVRRCRLDDAYGLALQKFSEAVPPKRRSPVASGTDTDRCTSAMAAMFSGGTASSRKNRRYGSSARAIFSEELVFHRPCTSMAIS